MSQAQIMPEIFVNFRPEHNPKSPAQLTTLVPEQFGSKRAWNVE